MKPLWDDGYGTHLPMVVAALGATQGPVLEMGAGYWSTPFLHQLCYDRELVTFEPEEDWRARFEEMIETSRRNRAIGRGGIEGGCRHSFVTEVPQGRSWSVVLVDGPVETRAPALDLDSEIFVVHDTEPREVRFYSYGARFDRFKYRRDFQIGMPHTSLLSNTVDVTRL